MPRNAPVARCGSRLTRADLDAGIDLGGRYMLAAQRPDGNFVYEVDWTTGRESADDNAVRQAGATWGMALLYRETRDCVYRAALDRSLAWWEADARAAHGRRWQGQHGASLGQLGTVALVGLSLLERLAAPEGLADPAPVRASLDAICTFAEAARLPGGGFHGTFDPKVGTYSGPADPYSSGESLLLLARSGLELGVPDRVARALAWAEEDYRLFVAKPLAKEPDPDVTKGYYQWSSMTWFALASAGYAPEIWGRRLIEQAMWMVDVHRTLARPRNTGYAYEGILPAWEWARRTGDDDAARKLACVVHQGLRKLCSWQLGHQLATEALRSAPERFHGAIQNHVKQPALRIDVTQHQVHALMYARQFGIDTAAHLCDAAAPAEARIYPTAEQMGMGTVPSRASPSRPFELAITHTYKGPNIHVPQPAVRCEVIVNDREVLSSNAIGRAVRRLKELLPELNEVFSAQSHDVNWGIGASFNRIQLAEASAIAAYALMRRIDEWISPVSSGVLENGGGFFLVCEYRRSSKNATAAAKLAVEILCSTLDDEKLEQALADFEHNGRRRASVALATAYSLEEAERRGIPVSMPAAGPAILGFGCLQRRLKETITSGTGYLPVRMAQNKVETANALRQIGLPVPEQYVVDNKENAVLAARRIGYPVVVKPIGRNRGKGVSVKLTSEAAVVDAYWEAAAVGRSVIVENYVSGSDYRLLVVDGELIAASQCVPAHVVGNGENTIGRLLEVANSDPRRDGRFMHKIKFDFDAQRMLEEQDLTLESVPSKGRFVALRSKASASAGGVCIGLTEHVHPDNRLLAIAAARALQLNIAAIDLITSDISRSYRETKGAICEVISCPELMDIHVEPASGSGVMVAPYILDMLFPPPSKGRIPIIAVFCGDSVDARPSLSIAHLLQISGHEVGLATHEGVWIGGDQIARLDAANFEGARRVLLHPCVSAAVIEVTVKSMLNEGLGFDFADVAVITNGFGKHLGSNEDVLTLIRSSAGARVLDDDDQVTRTFLPEVERGRIYLANRAPAHPSHENIIRVAQVDEAIVALDSSEVRHKIAIPAIGNAIQQAVLSIAACHAVGIEPDTIENALKANIDTSQNCRLLVSGLATPFGRILMVTPRNGQELETIFRMASCWAAPQSPDMVLHMSFKGDPELQAALNAQIQMGSARLLETDLMVNHGVDLLAHIFKDPDKRIVILTDNMAYFRKRLLKIANAGRLLGGTQDKSLKSVPADFEHQKQLRARLAWSTEHLLEEADRRAIPVNVSDSTLPILGLGCLQKRLRETATSETDYLAVEMAWNKVRTADVLRLAGLPVPNQYTVNNERDAIAAAQRIGYPVVVKPIDGNKGRGVSVKLTSEAAIAHAFEEAAKINKSVIVETYIAGSDHRLLVVDGEMVAASQRVPGHVMGNGRDTVERLLEQVNSDPRRNGRLMHKIKYDFDAQRMLEEQGLTLASVPDDGHIVALRSTSNVSLGGISVGLTERVHPDNRLLAIAAARALQLDIAGVDFITTDISRSYKETKGAICEINSFPMLLGLHVNPASGQGNVVAPYILDTLFPPVSTGRIPIIAIFCGDSDNDRLSHCIAHLLQISGYEVGLATHEGLWIGGDQISISNSDNFEGTRRALLHPCISAAVIEVSTESILSEGLSFDFADAAVITNGFAKLLSGNEHVAALVSSSAGALIVDDDAQVTKALSPEVGQGKIYLTNPTLAYRLHADVIKISASGQSIVTLETSEYRRSIAFPSIGNTARGIALSIAACHAIGISEEMIEDALKANLDTRQSGPLLINGLATSFGKILMATPRNSREFEVISEVARSWAAPQAPDTIFHMLFEGDPELSAFLDAQVRIGSARRLDTDTIDQNLPVLVFKDTDKRTVILTDNMAYFRKRLNGRPHAMGSAQENYLAALPA